MGRNCLTEKSHHRASLKTTSLNADGVTKKVQSQSQPKIERSMVKKEVASTATSTKTIKCYQKSPKNI
jgi:hypothetical protein